MYGNAPLVPKGVYKSLPSRQRDRGMFSNQVQLFFNFVVPVWPVVGMVTIMCPAFLIAENFPLPALVYCRSIQNGTFPCFISSYSFSSHKEAVQSHFLSLHRHIRFHSLSALNPHCIALSRPCPLISGGAWRRMPYHNFSDSHALLLHLPLQSVCLLISLLPSPSCACWVRQHSLPRMPFPR